MACIVDEGLLQQIREERKCCWCGKRGAVDPHHIFGRGMGGGSRLDVRINLVPLCRICHRLHHDGHIQRADLLAIAAAREGMQQDELVAEIYRLRRARKAG